MLSLCVYSSGGVSSVWCCQATNELVTRVPKSTNAEMEAAVASCKEAFRTWSKTTVLTRQQAMFKLQQLIKENMVSVRDDDKWPLTLAVILSSENFCLKSIFTYLRTKLAGTLLWDLSTPTLAGKALPHSSPKWQGVATLQPWLE